MKNIETIAVLVLVGVGSRYETERINGISHFLEHMFFKGTTKRPDKRQIAQELDAVGAAYNAFTGKEYTGYWVKTAAKHLELVTDVVSDIFLNSTIPAEEIEKERSVILGEIDMYEDMPMRKVGDIFEELLYPNHPAGWDIAGRKEVIGSVKRIDFTKYLRTHYRAPNTVVVFAGGLTVPQAKSLTKKYFTGMPKGTTPKAKPVKERQAEPAMAAKHKKSDQTHLVLGTRAYNLSDPRRWPLSLLTTILGGNMSSRLFMKIREELGLGYYINASTSLTYDCGYFDVSAGVDNRRLEEAISAILEELTRVKTDGITKQELKMAKEFIKGKTLLNLESADDLATFYGMQEVIQNKVLTPQEKFRMINKVTVEDVKNVAQNIFQNDKLNLALIGPIKNDSKIKKLLKI